MELVNSNLLINEEKSIKNSILYIRNINVNIESYEAKILAEENIDNIIKYQVMYEGENRVLKYDVSNTIGLSEYLKTKKLGKKDICNMLISIDDVLLSIENYLLSENSLALDLSLVRVVEKNKGGVSFKFIAIPNHNSDFSYELSRFLIRILRHVDVEDKEALSLAYGLFVRSSKDNYTMNDLMELVDKVYNRQVESNDEFNMEEIVKYDEEMAKEISEEIMEESKMNFIEEEEENNLISNTISSNDERGLNIDATTRNILGNNLLNDFDKSDEKIIKMNKKGFSFKKNKALKGQISFGIIAYALAPIIAILFPIIFFFVNA